MRRINDGLMTSATSEWLTPQHIIERVIACMGAIDLDPCSNSNTHPHVPAREHFSKAENGLTRRWAGRVYMNPPYGDEIKEWVERLLSCYIAGDVQEAIALLPARTDTAWLAPLWDYPLCFVRGRLRFVGASNSAPFPSVIVYFGEDPDRFVYHFGDLGRITREVYPNTNELTAIERLLCAMDHLTPADLPGLKAFTDDQRLVKVVDVYLGLPPEGRDKFKRESVKRIKRTLNAALPHPTGDLPAVR